MTPANESSSWTDEFEFTHSKFEISSLPINYYLTNVRLSSLEDNFSLVEDIPGSVNWGYNAIFQRNIDHERVEKELLNRYLLVEDKFKFFNPLTIALLPYDWEDNEVLDDYRGDWATAEEDDGPYVLRERDGIRVRSLPDTTAGKIQWDTDRIVGVAIDGQHRLSALMRFAGHPDQPQGVDPTEVRVPVVLLVFNTNDETDIITQVREIFIDINKNAKQVSKSRQILLDDRDPYAVFARDLVQDENNPDGLIYEVVDWKKESSKPDDTQLTTIVALYEIVKWIYNDNISILESKLSLNGAFRRRDLRQIETSDTSDVVLTEEQITVAREIFRETHKIFILNVFENITPFDEFIDSAGDMVSGDSEADNAFKEYIFSNPSDREDFDQVLEDRGLPEDLIERRLENLDEVRSVNSGAELLYTSIGQRGLFYYLSKVYSLYNSLDIEGHEQVSDAYIDDLEILIDNNFFERTKAIDGFSIWPQICVRGDNIAVSKASSYRFNSLVLLAISALRLNLITYDDIDSQTHPSLSPLFRRVKGQYQKRWETRLIEQRDDALDDEALDFTEEDVTELAEDKATDTVQDILEVISGWEYTDGD